VTLPPRFAYRIQTKLCLSWLWPVRLPRDFMPQATDKKWLAVSPFGTRHPISISVTSQLSSPSPKWVAI
jgi:hypothetical protein